jgi:hypothetical protein
MCHPLVFLVVGDASRISFHQRLDANIGWITDHDVGTPCVALAATIRVGDNCACQEPESRTHIALATPTNDVLDFPMHLLSPNFSSFRGR